MTDDKTNLQSLRWQKVTEAGTRWPVQQQKQKASSHVINKHYCKVALFEACETCELALCHETMLRMVLVLELIVTHNCALVVQPLVLLQYFNKPIISEFSTR